MWAPARVNRALRAAAAWASDGTESVRRCAVLGAVIVVYAAVLGARDLARLIRRERGIVVLLLALAIPVAALKFRSHPGAHTTDAPVSFGPAPARVTENKPPAEGVNESAKENARMAAWNRSVQQALTEAQAREQARPQDAEEPEHGDATAARNIVAQVRGATRTDLGFARELANEQAGTLSASNEDKAAAEAKAASGSGVAKEANAADDARQANETKGPEQSSDAGGQKTETLSTGRVDGWNRRAENIGTTKEIDDRDVAREKAIARHALVYSWVTIDRAGHRWVHIRTLHYSQR